MRAAALLAALLVLPAPRLRAASVAAKRRELSQIQQQLEQARRELDDARSQEQSLDRQLRRVASRTGQSKRRVEQLQRNIKKAERKRSELRARMASLGRASGYWRRSVDDELAAYVREQASRDDDYGRADLWREEYRRAALLDKVELLAGLQGISRTTALAEQQTRLRAVELAQRHKKAQQDQLAAQKELDQKKAAMAQTQEKVAAAAARAKELEESARALTALIRRLRRPRGAPAQSTAQHWDVSPNSLLWPAQGSVLKPFGKQRNPELNTWVISQGILLRTPPQADVEAVRGGKVIFAGPFKSYGQVLILDHGSNFYSIYGSLGALLKQKGSDVKPGEVIAKAGVPKKGDGGRVYLELRRGTDAVDPLVWLQKR